MVQISGNVIHSVDNSDVFYTFDDLWKMVGEWKNAHYQGIDTSNGCNVTKFRIGAANGKATIVADKVIADVYKNRYCIPPDYELLESSAPFAHSGLGDRSEYEITFNSCDRVTLAENDPDTSYAISDICLEYDMVTP